MILVQASFPFEIVENSHCSKILSLWIFFKDNLIRGIDKCIDEKSNLLTASNAELTRNINDFTSHARDVYKKVTYCSLQYLSLDKYNPADSPLSETAIPMSLDTCVMYFKNVSTTKLYHKKYFSS